MGLYVFTLIAFPVVDDCAEFRTIAMKHADRLRTDRKEAISLHFLDALVAGRCVQCSTKGHAVAFAAVGNYVLLEGLRTDLLPFFAELYLSEMLLDFERIVVMINREQTDGSDVMEISWNEEPQLNAPVTLAPEQLTVRIFERQEFHWGQA